MNYLLFFLLVTVAFCQDEYGCEDCECPDLLNFLYMGNGEVLYTEEAGCVRNITCAASTGGTFVFFNINETEITRPVGNYYDHPRAITPTPDAPTSVINIFQYFGMICEKEEWYITKYPGGVMYYRIGGGEFEMGTNGELDGKKSKIMEWACSPPS